MRRLTNNNTAKNIRHVQQQLQQDRTYPIRSPATMWPPYNILPTAHPPFPTMLFYSPSPAPGNLVVKETGYLRGPGTWVERTCRFRGEHRTKFSQSVSQAYAAPSGPLLALVSLSIRISHRIASRDPLLRLQVLAVSVK